MKMLSPSLRPSGFVRYGIVAMIVMMALYAFNYSSPNLNYTAAVPSRPAPVAAATNGPAAPPGTESAPSNKHEATAPEANPQDGNAESPAKEAKPATPNKGDTPQQAPSSGDSSPGGDKEHPIGKLIYDSQMIFGELTSKESKTVQQAAQAYRKRRGRHPPPGFDKWFEFARDNNAVIIEDFFDQIYHDLEPFWGMEPSYLRKESSDFEMTINIRNGKASTQMKWFWTDIWLNMIKTVEHLLPDMDLALNAMDEPRIVVPWEDVNGYMKKAADTSRLPVPQDVVSDYKNLPEPRKGDPDAKVLPKNWEGTSPFWDIVRRGCPPDSKARTTELQGSFAEPPVINTSNADAHSYKGFVSNYTLSAELCHQPDLQGLEGIFIAPLSTKSTKTMFPLFGGSKLAVNNEILLPAPMYWNEEERFTGGDDHGIQWSDKKNSAIWRGVATGGENREENWRGFQRHRFIAMNNGTQVSLVESGKEKPQNFALPEKQDGLQAQKDGKLGEWINQWTNVSFIDLSCFPGGKELEKLDKKADYCNYTAPYFHTTKGLKMAEQFNYKFLPDIDGNSFSGRYLGFLRSTSLPVKATLWREWHDSRLVAWKHFVPMDSRFGDYYGIMEYFLGYQGHNGHDRAAEKIATEGKEWAEKVLRKEDMRIYVVRLLLEYARLLDERRETMGWVEDVVNEPSLSKIWKSWW